MNSWWLRIWRTVQGTVGDPRHPQRWELKSHKGELKSCDIISPLRSQDVVDYLLAPILNPLRHIFVLVHGFSDWWEITSQSFELVPLKTVWKNSLDDQENTWQRKLFEMKEKIKWSFAFKLGCRISISFQNPTNKQMRCWPCRMGSQLNSWKMYIDNVSA